MHAVLTNRISIAAETTDCQAGRVSPGQSRSNSDMQLQSLQTALSGYLAKPPSAVAALLQSQASSQLQGLASAASTGAHVWKTPSTAVWREITALAIQVANVLAWANTQQHLTCRDGDQDGATTSDTHVLVEIRKASLT